MKSITVTIHENSINLSFIKSSYLNNNNTYISAIDSNGEYWSDISINLYTLNKPDNIFISDLCNVEIIEVLEDMGLIISSGKYECLEVNYYPEYILSSEFLNEWCTSF